MTRRNRSSLENINSNTDAISVLIFVSFLLSLITTTHNTYPNEFFTVNFSFLTNYYFPFHFLLLTCLAFVIVAEYKNYSKQLTFFILILVNFFSFVRVLIHIQEFDSVEKINFNDWGIGFYAAVVCLILSVSYLFIYWKLKAFKFEVTQKSFQYSIVLGIIMFGYWLGTWMPWETKTFEITKSDQVWKINNSKIFSDTCCYLFQDTLFGDFKTFIEILLTIVIILLVAYEFNYKNISRYLFIYGLYSMIAPVKWILQPVNKNLDALKEGYTRQEIYELGIIVVKKNLLGGWITLTSAILLVIFAIYVNLQSQIKSKSR